jgi:hypothetical protein
MNEVIKAEYIKDYVIKVYFSNGKSGNINFEKYISRGGVFSKLKNIELFKKYTVNTDFGTICWENEIDIDPETLYSDATGEELPLWMHEEEYKKAS